MHFRYAIQVDQLNSRAKDELLTKLVASGALTLSGYRTIDKVMLEHKPLPKWALDNVLLSPDLLLKILSYAHLLDASRVCKTWHSLWLKLGSVVHAVGPKPTGRTWREEWVDMWMEWKRMEGKHQYQRSYCEPGGHASIEARLRMLSFANAIQWQVNHGWSRADAEAYTLIACCVAAPFATAVRERSDRYAVSTHAVCDALTQRARQLTEAAPPVYLNLFGQFGIATTDPAFAALGPEASVGLSFVTNSIAQGEPVFSKWSGFYISDVVCFRSAPAAADGYHSLIQVNAGTYALPPFATVKLERVQQPGDWEGRQRLFTMSVCF